MNIFTGVTNTFMPETASSSFYIRVFMNISKVCTLFNIKQVQLLKNVCSLFLFFLSKQKEHFISATITTFLSILCIPTKLEKNDLHRIDDRMLTLLSYVTTAGICCPCCTHCLFNAGTEVTCSPCPRARLQRLWVLLVFFTSKYVFQCYKCLPL